MARPFPHVEGVEHRYVDAGSLTMHVAEAGPADGESIVPLHGWPQHWYEWRHQIPPLAQHYRVIAPDLRALREQHTSRSPVETRLQIIDAAIDAVHENDVVIVWKSRYLDAAVLLALFGLLVVTGRVIYFLQGGS